MSSSEIPSLSYRPLTAAELAEAAAAYARETPEERRRNRMAPEDWTAFARDDDPFGLDWSWLFVSEEEYRRIRFDMRDEAIEQNEGGSEAGDISLSANLDRPAAKSRTISRNAWFAIAASLLFAFGLGYLFRPGLGRPGPGGEFLVAAANVTQSGGVVRGNAELPTFQVKSARNGFVTVIAIYNDMRPDDFFVDPEESSPALRVAANKPLDYAFSGTVPASALVFVVTETQADATIRREFVNLPSLPATPDKMKSILTDLLKGAGYQWVEISAINVKQNK